MRLFRILSGTVNCNGPSCACWLGGWRRPKLDICFSPYFMDSVYYSQDLMSHAAHGTGLVLRKSRLSPSSDRRTRNSGKMVADLSNHASLGN